MGVKTKAPGAIFSSCLYTCRRTSTSLAGLPMLESRTAGCLVKGHGGGWCQRCEGSLWQVMGDLLGVAMMGRPVALSEVLKEVVTVEHTTAFPFNFVPVTSLWLLIAHFGSIGPVIYHFHFVFLDLACGCLFCTPHWTALLSATHHHHHGH